MLAFRGAGGNGGGDCEVGDPARLERAGGDVGGGGTSISDGGGGGVGGLRMRPAAVFVGVAILEAVEVDLRGQVDIYFQSLG